VQAKACVCEDGRLKHPSESAAFGSLASVVPAGLKHVMHPDYEIRASDLHLGTILGEGEFGVVHRARWRGTPVAVKVLREGQDIRFEELATEIASLLKVHHPNIVHFLGACTLEQPFLIVTEIMEGGSLETALRGGARFSLRRALEIALDCARGLEYLHVPHPSSIIHRDLKPSNVMISGNGVAMSAHELALDTGVAKLTDFGLSKARAAPVHTCGAARRLRAGGCVLACAAMEIGCCGSCRLDVVSNRQWPLT
jgi:serine/threonine protein kinase